MPLPFLLRRSWESGGFRQSPPEAQCFMSLRPGKPHSPLLGAVGHWRFPLPSRKQESRGGFSVSVCRGHCFMALRPGTRTAHRWGTGRFRTVPPEVGKPSGLFPRARRGHCFMARCPGTLTVHRRCCGAMDAFAPSRGNGIHAIKEKSGGNFLRFSDSRQGLLGTEDTVAGIARPGMMYLCSSRWSSREAQ